MVLIENIVTVLGGKYKKCAVKVQNVHITQDPVGNLTTESKFNMLVQFEVFKYINSECGEVIDIGAKSIAVEYPLDSKYNAIEFAYKALRKIPVFSKSKEV